jgi:hypothetical protein
MSLGVRLAPHGTGRAQGQLASGIEDRGRPQLPSALTRSEATGTDMKRTGLMKPAWRDPSAGRTRPAAPSREHRAAGWQRALGNVASSGCWMLSGDPS